MAAEEVSKTFQSMLAISPKTELVLIAALFFSLNSEGWWLIAQVISGKLHSVKHQLFAVQKVANLYDLSPSKHLLTHLCDFMWPTIQKLSFCHVLCSNEAENMTLCLLIQ